MVNSKCLCIYLDFLNEITRKHCCSYTGVVEGLGKIGGVGRHILLKSDFELAPSETLEFSVFKTKTKYSGVLLPIVNLAIRNSF